MGTYRDAKVAVRTHLATNWTATRIAYQNEVPADPWPPSTGSPFPTLSPFVYFEMRTLPGQTIRGVGLPGDQLSQTNGFIYVHVFVPAGSGEATATQYAEQIGELFRARKLYEHQGSYLRSWVPRVDEGGDAGVEIAGINAGAWFRASMSVPFQYFHQG